MARILVVDDDPTIGGMLAMLLRHDGHSATVADHLDGAKRSIDQHRPDLVITDLDLSGEDGTDLVNWAATEHHELRTVLMSGCSQGEVESSARSSGADGWLKKPFVVSELRSVISALLGGAHVELAAA